MRRLSTIFTLLLAVSAFAIVVTDVENDFASLGRAAWPVTLFVALLFVPVLRSPSPLERRVAGVLLAGSLTALLVRNLGYGQVLRRAPEDWEVLRERHARRIASRAAERFGELSRQASSTALELARLSSEIEPRPAAALFSRLEEMSLPRAHPLGAPGATVYDPSYRPIAWTGTNVSLEAELRQASASETLVLERGVETFLVAIEPLAERAGFATVEIPLAVDRRLENRYLEDFDAPSSWVGRNLVTQYLLTRRQREEKESLLAAAGDSFWGGIPEAPRFFFGMYSAKGDLLAVSSVAGEDPVLAQIEARRWFRLAASVALLGASLLALVLLFRSRPPLVESLVAVWGARLVLEATELPLGLGLDLDNPAHYASSILFGLTRSPIDLLLTGAAVCGTVSLLAERWTLRPAPLRSARMRSLLAALASAVTLTLFLGANHVVRDAWLNSTMALGSASAGPFEPSRLVVQIALLVLFLSCALAGLAIFSWAEGAGEPSSADFARAFVSNGIIALTAYLLLAPEGLGEHVLLSVPPVLVLHIVAQARKRPFDSRPRLCPRDLVFLVLFAVPAFYPSLARFEETTIRAFIETTVTPVVLQHRRTSLDVLAETARTVDRMSSENRLPDLDREDVAYRIWVSTDLAVSSLGSSVEVLDAAGNLVSRFSLSFPLGAPGDVRPRAPLEWIVEQEEAGAEHPGFMMTRRSLPADEGAMFEIRLLVAADWRNLPFISTLNPYLVLFRTSGVDTLLRFPYREFELSVLESDGTAVFQSAGGAIHPDAELLRAARTSPVWWQHHHEDQVHRTYLFADEDYVYGLSYPEKPALAHAAEFAGFFLMALALAGSVVGAFVLSGIFSWHDLWAGVMTSFHGKLYVAFVLIALVPIVSLAFVIRGLVVRQLERDVEQDGMARAEVVRRLVLEPSGAPDNPPPITDAVLERVGALADVDADIYRRGRLAATSTPELFAAGLLRPRAVASAHRDIVLDRLSHSIHRESVGAFEYLVVSVPIALEPSGDPGMLSLPLASQRPEIERKVSSLNQRVLLAALGFSLAAAILAYWLARLVARPINTLTRATHRVAGGDFDVSLPTDDRDEIGALFRSFSQMMLDLKRQRDELERTKKLEAWAEMARQVAHEVKNPLTPIQLSTEHLRRVYGDPGVDFEQVLEQCSDTILKQVSALRQISMEFSTFASPEPLKLESTDVGALVKETMRPYVGNLPDGVGIEVAVDPSLPPLSVDRRLLKRTLVNLVENALQSMDGGGKIRVGATGHNLNGRSFVELVVQDTGRGVDPEIRERIFEPYFSTRAKGTGLGLAIAKKVVEDHGGTIALESEPGKGTRVSVMLPV